MPWYCIAAGVSAGRARGGVPGGGGAQRAQGSARTRADGAEARGGAC